MKLILQRQKPQKMESKQLTHRPKEGELCTVVIYDHDLALYRTLGKPTARSDGFIKFACYCLYLKGEPYLFIRQDSSTNAMIPSKKIDSTRRLTCYIIQDIEDIFKIDKQP